MAETGWARHSLSVGFFEFRRSVRAIWQDKGRFALMALGVLIPSLMSAAFVVVFAETIRGVERFTIPNQLRGTVALFWLFAVFMIGQRVVSARTRIEAESLMLTTVSARTVAGGLILAEILRILAYLGFPLLVLTGVGVFLFGSPASLVFVPLAALLFTATAVVTGTVCGYAVAWLVATSKFVARHKTVLGTAGSFILMGGYFTFFFPQIEAVDQAALAWLPVGWFADLGVIGTPLIGSTLRSVGVLLSSTVLLIGGGILAEREVVALWFTEPVSVETGESTRESAVTGNEGPTQTSRRDALAAAVKPLVVPRIVSTPARHVAEWALLRTRREQNRLTFLLIPVFTIASTLLSTGLQSGSLRALAVPVCAILVPGLVLGLPAVIVVTSIAGMLSPYTVAKWLGLVILGVYLTCVSVAITPAVGMALPRFSAISVGQSREVLPPRMSAAVLHMALLMIPGALLMMLVIIPRIARGVLAVLFGSLPAFLLGLLTDSRGGLLSTGVEWFNHVSGVIRAVEIGQLQTVAGGMLLISGALVLILLYRHAINRFNRYSPS